MKTKTLLLLGAAGLAALVALSGCARTEPGEPGPTGPSTFATLLKVTARPNTIFAGTNWRGTTTITANLRTFDGQPISGRTIFFEVTNGLGQKVDVGYFEGMEAVPIRTTDGGGNVSLTYFGPLAAEIAANATVYLKVTSALDGTNFVSEHARIDIVADSSAIQFMVRAYPDVLLATDQKPQSEIVATVFRGSVPWIGRKVYFQILSGPGAFSDNSTTAVAEVDGNGIAKVVYVGPKGSEIMWDMEILIRGQLETDTTLPPEQRILEEIQVRVIKGI